MAKILPSKSPLDRTIAKGRTFNGAKSSSETIVKNGIV
jgi:hypothetical protein